MKTLTFPLQLAHVPQILDALATSQNLTLQVPWHAWRLREHWLAGTRTFFNNHQPLPNPASAPNSVTHVLIENADPVQILELCRPPSSPQVLQWDTPIPFEPPQTYQEHLNLLLLAALAFLDNKTMVLCAPPSWVRPRTWPIPARKSKTPDGLCRQYRPENLLREYLLPFFARKALPRP